MPGFYLPSENEFDPSIDDFVLRSVSKERNYKHFDLPLTENDREREIDFTQETQPHRFWPLLGFTDITRRYVRVGPDVRERKSKPRPIRFAGHEDAAYGPIRVTKTSQVQTYDEGGRVASAMASATALATSKASAPRPRSQP